MTIITPVNLARGNITCRDEKIPRGRNAGSISHSATEEYLASRYSKVKVHEFSLLLGNVTFANRNISHGGHATGRKTERKKVRHSDRKYIGVATESKC